MLKIENKAQNISLIKIPRWEKEEKEREKERMEAIKSLSELKSGLGCIIYF